MSERETLESFAACDEALTGLRREEREIPTQIGQLEARIEASKQNIEAEHERLAEADRKRRDLEAELQDRESQRDKFQAQTALVKTNAEYSTLLREIDTTTSRIGQIEEGILEAMDRIEELGVEVEASVERETAALKQVEKELDERRRRFQQVERDLVARDQERETLLDALDPLVASHYRRVFGQRGNGVARVSGRSCGACRRDIPFEIINRVSAGEFHTCEACQRILLGEPD